MLVYYALRFVVFFFAFTWNIEQRPLQREIDHLPNADLCCQLQAFLCCHGLCRGLCSEENTLQHCSALAREPERSEEKDVEENLFL